MGDLTEAAIVSAVVLGGFFMLAIIANTIWAIQCWRFYRKRKK